MDKTANGWINGFLGVLIFSGSLPATRAAVSDFDPIFLTVARAAIAGLLGLILLLVFRQKRPACGEAGSDRVRHFGCAPLSAAPLLPASLWLGDPAPHRSATC
jgi:drug/metabolite transporter (DMT)-like permease